MAEIILTCPECEDTFPFTDEEQAYCTEHAFPAPSRCPECQRRRKATKDEERDAKNRRGRSRSRKR